MIITVINKINCSLCNCKWSKLVLNRIWEKQKSYEHSLIDEKTFWMEYSIDELNSEKIISYRCLVNIVGNDTQRNEENKAQF